MVKFSLYQLIFYHNSINLKQFTFLLIHLYSAVLVLFKTIKVIINIFKEFLTEVHQRYDYYYYCYYYFLISIATDFFALCIN